MSETKVRMYTTKYALTRGIGCLEGFLSGGYFYHHLTQGGLQNQYRVGEFFPTREEAVEKAKSLRTAKIATLRKQIKLLEEMTFGE